MQEMKISEHTIQVCMIYFMTSAAAQCFKSSEAVCVRNKIKFISNLIYAQCMKIQLQSAVTSRQALSYSHIDLYNHKSKLCSPGA